MDAHKVHLITEQLFIFIRNDCSMVKYTMHHKETSKFDSDFLNNKQFFSFPKKHCHLIVQTVISGKTDDLKICHDASVSSVKTL